MITLREARLPEDAEQITRIDNSFTTDRIYTVYHHGDQLGLMLTTLPTPVTKRFPFNDLDKQDKPWEFAVVAIVADRICGFLAVGYQAWNRRLTIWHLYVDGSHRRRGIARLLVERAQGYALTKSAVHMWLETSSVNAPGAQVYRRLGFELCGFDTTLYDGTPASGETALFFACPIRREREKNSQ
jgi:ribosomal protein S18 acetylase RimI-like enzyme